ncbi:MAG: glycoside hydrolase family 26 protein [Phycisphaerae bacterium]
MCVTCTVTLVVGAVIVWPPASTRRAPLDWGIYQILWSRRYADHVAAEVSKFASKPQYVMFFRDLGGSFPKTPIDAVAEQGATAVVSLELWRWHGGGKRSHLPAIAAGDYDAYLTEWARAAKADGRRVVLRFGFEFNGNWFTWAGDPTAYVAAWRHAHDIFDKVGATNVEWAWAPNVVSCPDTPDNNMHRYYPGDAYVDWIGVDGYNFGDHHDKWHKWQSFHDIYAPLLKDFQRRYADKPVMITEFGCAPGRPGQRARWIRDAYAELEHFDQVKAAIWFHFDKRREGEPDWRIDVTPESLRAFNETFARPRTP